MLNIKSKVFILLSSCIFSGMTYASYMERCQFTAKPMNVIHLGKLDASVRENAELVLIFKIMSAKNSNSHIDTACNNHVGQLNVVTITREQYQSLRDENGQLPTSISLNYRYVNSLHPSEGVISSTSWELVK